MRKKLVASLVIVLFMSLAVYSQAVYAVEFSGVVVSTDFVAKHLKTIRNPAQTEIRLVEVSKKGYDKGHIPGAVHIKWGSEVFNPLSDHMILTYTEVKAVMKKLGVTKKTDIIIYASKIDQATRFYWTLKFWKVNNLHIMNGSKGKWIKERREMTKVVPSVSKLNYNVSYPPNTKIRAQLTPNVFYALSTGKSIFIDCRPAAYYKGKKYSIKKWVRTGHIPGAKNVACPEETNNRDGSFKSKAELKAIFAKVGVTGNKPVIAYCNTGVRSSLGWFVLSELLRYKHISNYDGSMREYANRLDLPIVPPNIYPKFPK
ncbi:thiosulfate sulfurtransferase [bacterium BMS3Abin08]|nr:thiosulfate sulfurtransferase [bacterium BMS3Abin08]